MNGPDGRGLDGISVVESTGRFSALSGSDGHFSLDLPLGEYTLITRGLGYQEQRRTVVLTAATPRLTVDFALLPPATALQEVEVLGRRETTYKSDYSFVGTKTATRPLDVPQSISTVTKELMADRQALRLTDVVKNVAGRYAVFALRRPDHPGLPQRLREWLPAAQRATLGLQLRQLLYPGAADGTPGAGWKSSRAPVRRSTATSTPAAR